MTSYSPRILDRNTTSTEADILLINTPNLSLLRDASHVGVSLGCSLVAGGLSRAKFRVLYVDLNAHLAKNRSKGVQLCSGTIAYSPW